MLPTEKWLKQAPKILGITVSILIVAALPLSFLPGADAADDGCIGITLERRPRGWEFTLQPGVSYRGYGYTAGIGHGIFFGSFDRLAPNPKPVRPPPYEMDHHDSDNSHLFGSPRLGCAVGTLLLGDVYSSMWTARTGVFFPFWPVSFAATLWLALLFIHWKRQTNRIKDHLRPTCSYDLRASNDKCPECGMPISASAPQSPPYNAKSE